ncbi:MAG: phage tail protein [Alphaproteobacteria bacterium]
MAEPSVLASFRFRVEIDGIAQAGFSEVHVAEATIEVIEHREGTDPTHVRKLPGLAKYGNVTLKWGATASNELFNWWKAIADGQLQRRNMVVSLLDEQNRPVKRWAMRNVWPVRYAVSPLVALDGRVAVTETLECAVESMVAEAG